MRWWRAYTAARHDPKLLRLSDKHFRWWFNMLCLAGEHEGRLPSITDMAAEFRMSPKAMKQIVATLMDAGLLEEVEHDTYEPHNWASRQFKSDVSSERVKRHRERQRNVTGNAECNVSETPSENRVQRTDSSEPNGSDIADVASVVFTEGLRWLMAKTGRREEHCRSQLGKWRKDIGGAGLIEVLGAAQREGPIDPMAWLEAAVRARQQKQAPPAKAVGWN